MQNGELQIEPIPPGGPDGRIQSCCIDLLLDSVIQVPTNGGDFTVELDTFNSSRFIERNSRRVDMDDTSGHVIEPGGFIIGHTVETVRLSPRLAGRIEGRSRFARVGIGVHVTAPKIDPGFAGRITLEIFNLGKHNCRFTSNMAIATLLVEWLSSPAERAYQGQFQGQ
jgi:dCTP deaminase